MARLAIRDKKKSGRKPEPHGAKVLRKGWERQVLEVLGRGLTYSDSVKVLEKEYGIKISYPTFREYKKNYFETNEVVKKEVELKRKERESKIDEEREKTVQRLIEKAESAVDYYEQMIIRLEKRMQELEKSSATGSARDSAYCAYAREIREYQELKFKIKAAVDVDAIRKKVAAEVIQLAIEVFYPNLLAEVKSKCVMVFKQRLKEIFG